MIPLWKLGCRWWRRVRKAFARHGTKCTWPEARGGATCDVKAYVRGVREEISDAHAVAVKIVGAFVPLTSNTSNLGVYVSRCRWHNTEGQPTQQSQNNKVTRTSIENPERNKTSLRISEEPSWSKEDKSSSCGAANVGQEQRVS